MYQSSVPTKSSMVTDQEKSPKHKCNVHSHKLVSLQPLKPSTTSSSFVMIMAMVKSLNLNLQVFTIEWSKMQVKLKIKFIMKKLIGN